MRRGDRQTACWLLLAGLVLLRPPGAAMALETDQYLTWGVELEDSAGPINAYVNERLRLALARINAGSRQRAACEDLPPKLFRDLFHDFFFCRIHSFANKSSEVKRFPADDLGYRAYVKASIFRTPAFPYFLPLARSIRVGEVVFGIDKLSHLFSFGRRYYERYQRRLRRGEDEQEALREVILHGRWVEEWLVGQRMDGVFSNADLEANYQGFMLARDLCAEGYLQPSGDRWTLARDVDLTAYVTPAFDESYNSNLYSPFRWRSVEQVLVREYCPIYNSPPVAKRIEIYRRLDRPSFSRQVVADYYAEKGLDLEREQSPATLCAPTAAAEAPTATAAR